VLVPGAVGDTAQAGEGIEGVGGGIEGEGIEIEAVGGMGIEVAGGIGVVEGIEAEVPEGIEVDHDLEEHREEVEEHSLVEGVEDHIREEQHILPGEVVGEVVRSVASVVYVALVQVQEVQILVPWEFLPRGWGSRGTG